MGPILKTTERWADGSLYYWDILIAGVEDAVGVIVGVQEPLGLRLNAIVERPY
jgi:hypothetical protein